MHRLHSIPSLDAGWLYVIAGVALCASGILVPAQFDLASLDGQRVRLLQENDHAQARIKASQAFLAQLDRGDPQLIRRLAASQLNLLPADTTPVLMAASRRATVSEWIDDTVRVERPGETPARASLLGRLTGGRYRLWILGGGIVLVFAGLLIDGTRQPVNRLAGLVVPCRFTGRVPEAILRPSRRHPIVIAPNLREEAMDEPDDREPFLDRSVEDCEAGDLNPWFDE